MSTDTADAAPATPLQQWLAAWLVAMTDGDKCLRRAVAAELAERLPEREQDKADADAVLEKVHAAARGPERDAAALDEEIARNEGELAAWRALLDPSRPVGDRVEARRWVEEYENELAGLRERRDFVTAQLLPLRDAVTKAERDVEAAAASRHGAELNATPLLAYYGAGQKTSAYVALRFGLALKHALTDESDPEHGAAIEHMLDLCEASGFRTENFADRLSDDARAAARFWDQKYADANPPQPPPSGREVMEALHTEMTLAMVNKSLDASPSRIDDYRGPAPPKTMPDRSYMKVPRVKDYLG